MNRVASRLVAHSSSQRERGIALLAVLMALTLLLLLALPFSVSMSRGADVSARSVEVRKVELLSASARDLMLGEAALGHATYDETPDSDGLDEFPASVPDAFPALRMDGRARFGGETWDLQRFVALDAITPMLLSNLLGSTARIAAELLPDATEITLDDASRLPDSGFVWIDHEVIRYAGKQGNALTGCERSLFVDQGFVKADEHQVAETALALDWRCVLACAWPFHGRTGGDHAQRQPFATASELAEIERSGTGGFQPAELDALRAALGDAADVATAPVWGRPERVFYDVPVGSRRLVVKSALHLGSGSTVRLRSLETGAIEYGLVMTALTPQSAQELQLPSVYELSLLFPVAQEWKGMDTVVEPLVPAPVNCNTASMELLTALFTGCRRALDVRVRDASGARRITPMQPLSVAEAREIAEQIVLLRSEEPIRGFEELAQKVFGPRLADASQEQKLRLLVLYRLLLTGRDSVVEMGMAPITFRSGPLVGYRAAAALQRSVVAPAIAARHERTGIAVAEPGMLLASSWQTQERLEEAFRLDQRAPFWLTGPENVGATGGGELGNDPVSRYVPHVVGMAFPDMGLGTSRYPSRGETDAAIFPGPVSIRPGEWPRNGPMSTRARYGHEAFSTTIDPRGHDIARGGPFRIRNTGPRDQNAAPQPPRTHELTHPFTTPESKGGAGRFAVSAWFEPQALGNGVLFDYGSGDAQRNRMALLVRENKLVYEVLDEAGLDPDPGQSPAGVTRTSARWELPLAELALPPRTPVHVSATAYSSRPSDLTVAVDGFARGKKAFRTTLTAALPGYDPQQSPQLPPGQATNDPRNVVLQVESTTGFPAQGVLRIGTELFEYTDIQGNSFVCQPRDSTGGRASRQIGREHRPDIPVDNLGRPTIDVNSIAQGANLDQFPNHPSGAEVELYGYSAVPSSSTLMFLGSSSVDALGGFAVARGWLTNSRPIVLSAQGLPPIRIGQGIDLTWTGDLELADPRTSNSRPPAAASAAISDAFPTRGGFALLVQRRFRFSPPLGQVATQVLAGGVEVIRYASRNGNKLVGVQRAVVLPGNNSQINQQFFDGMPSQFVTDWDDNFMDPRVQPPLKWDEDPLRMLSVVPISLALQNAADMPDPSVTGTTEWVQLFSQSQPNDTEWVRYDAIVDRTHLVRTFRGSWESTRAVLTNQFALDDVQVGPLGPVGGAAPTPQAPWPAVVSTSGYIGYIPKLESDYPQIYLARQALQFRGDPFTRTSSHSQQNAIATPCHRLDLWWGNFGAMTGRPGRHDRVALVQGSSSSGSQRPRVEWHTVNWSVRQYTGDLQYQNPPPERTSPDPFQLMAFQAPVQLLIRGQQRGAPITDMRLVDRVVKFPSGELPAATCDAVVAGGNANSGETMAGAVDEISVADQCAFDLVVDEEFPDQAQQFLVRPNAYVAAHGLVYVNADLTVDFPQTGGLVQIDDEILAYQGHANGTFQVARNGRGLLGTKPQGHDRGSRVRFLTHRPAGITTASLSPRDEKIQLQAAGAMPKQFGSVLLNRTEIAHYTWTRTLGTGLSLEMPRFFPPGENGDTMAARGLFRGRYGSAAASLGAGEPVILMPTRHWDRHVDRSDDPEQAYFQLTTREAPVYFRGIRWEEETQDPTVDIKLLVRADAKLPWREDTKVSPWLRELERSTGDSESVVLDLQATQLELRFVHVYSPGCLDLQTYRAHGWKTAPKVRNIELEYEGEPRIVRETGGAR
jgi:hypothetical protein